MMAKFKVGDVVRFVGSVGWEYECDITILSINEEGTYKCIYKYDDGRNKFSYWGPYWPHTSVDYRWIYSPSNLDNFVTRKLQLAGLL